MGLKTMSQTVRWIRERKRGATKGGERLHLEKDGRWLPAPELAKDKTEYSSDYVAYAVEADDRNDWYGIRFSSNQNNRHYSLERYKHRDFPREPPDSWNDDAFPDRRERLEREETDYSAILEKVDQTRLFEERRAEIENLHPEIRRLADASDSEFTKASPGVRQALDYPNRFFVSAALLGSGGTRSLGNVKKAFQQAYEVEALRQALDLTVGQGNLSRRWQTGGLPPGDRELEVPRDVRKQLGIGFGRPNFVLKGRRTYSVWLEFPFTKYTRPDLFILQGEHDSAFKPSVRRYLNEYDTDFYQDVVDEWRSGFEALFTGDNVSVTGGTSPEAVRDFVTGLANHLKPGIVIESKEESGEADEAEDQVSTYHAIFSRQQVVLLTWFSWSGRIPSGVEVIDDFGTGGESAQELADLVRRLT